jgi:DeoR/GlpR family transcriptional regulator of sugar metabolism
MDEITNKSTNINLKELELNDRQINALTLITNSNESFSTKIYAKQFNISIRTLNRDLNKLLEERYIVKYYNKNIKD